MVGFLVALVIAVFVGVLLVVGSIIWGRLNGDIIVSADFEKKQPQPRR